VHSSGVARIWRWWHRGSGERKSPTGSRAQRLVGGLGDIVSRKLIAVIKDIWLPIHAQFCVFHSTAQPEIFLWTQFRGGGRAPRPSFPLAAPLVHTDYLLKLQGLPDAQLSVIANAVIISRLLYRYALPAWGGFLSVKLINRINAFLRRMQRFGYFQCGITVAELMNKSDHDLFFKLCAPTHALNHLLPPTRRTRDIHTSWQNILKIFIRNLFLSVLCIALSSEIVFFDFAALYCTSSHSDCFLCLLFDVRSSHLINITCIHITKTTS